MLCIPTYHLMTYWNIINSFNTNKDHFVKSCLLLQPHISLNQFWALYTYLITNKHLKLSVSTQLDIFRANFHVWSTYLQISNQTTIPDEIFIGTDFHLICLWELKWPGITWFDLSHDNEHPRYTINWQWTLPSCSLRVNSLWFH